MHKDKSTGSLDKYEAPVAESEIQKWRDPRACWSGSIGELVSSRFKERLCYKQISCRVLENTRCRPLASICSSIHMYTTNTQQIKK